VSRQARNARSSLKALIATVGCLGVLFSVNVAAASADTAWEINSHHGPTTFQAGGIGEYTFFVENSSDTPSSGPVQIQIELPPGVETRVNDLSPFFGAKTWFTTLPGSSQPSGWDCTVPGPEGPIEPVPGGSTLTCTSLIDPVTSDGNGSPRGLGRLTLFVDIAPGVEGELPATATVQGGGGASASVTEVARIADPEAEFEIEADSIQADAYDRDGLPLRQAGAHPFRAVAAFDFSSKRIFQKIFGFGPDRPALDPIDTVRTVTTKLPRGFVGNPGAIERCDPSLFAGGLSEIGTNCPPSSQVGVIQVALQNVTGFALPANILVMPVYNLEPPKGRLADFGFRLSGRPVHILAGLDHSDYSVVATVPDINEQLPTH
jgi:hypothetical protein